LTWRAPPEADLASYNIYRRTGASGYALLSSGLTSNIYDDATVQAGPIYHYILTAVDSAGNESEPSIETRELLSPPSILRTYAVSDVQVTAKGDLNGDGQTDLAFGHFNANQVEIFLGGNLSNTPNYTLFGERNRGASFGFSLAMTDLNRDGFDELLVGDPSYSLKGKDAENVGVGKAYIYAGGSQFDTGPAFAITGSPQAICLGGLSAGAVGHAIAAVGDINGDGYWDAVVGAPDVLECRYGKIIFIMGGPDLSSLTGSEWIGPNPWGFAGYAVSAAGDVNGDGFDDVLVGAPASSGFQGVNIGKAYLFTGGPSVQLSATFETGIENDSFGQEIASAGDINGDGFADIAVRSASGVHLFYGGPTIDAAQDLMLGASPFGTRGVFPIGRVNPDGFDDLIVGRGINLYFGGSSGENVADITRNGGNILGVIDLNSDGVNEVITSDAVSPSTSIRIESLSPYSGLPEIQIAAPANGTTTLSQTISLQGQVLQSIQGLSVDGVALTPAADGAFQTGLSLVEGENIIEVIADTLDGRLSKRTLHITYVIPPPLIVTIVNPGEGSVLNGTPISVRGTISDPNGSVTVQGQAIVVTENSFTGQGEFNANGVALAEGPNLITAIGTDAYGQTATATINVTLLTKETVTGTVSDAATGLPVPDVNVTVFGPLGPIDTTTDANGLYTVDVTGGEITVSFSKAGYVADEINATLAIGQTLTLDRALVPKPPLILSIDSPLEGEVFNASPITVTGTVSNNAAVMVNGAPVPLSGNTWSTSMPLTEGLNPIGVTATDSFGQSETQNISVSLVTLGALTGMTTDAETGLLVSAGVTLTDASGSTNTAYANSNGQYTFPFLPQGNFTATAFAFGYRSYPFAGTIVAGQTLTQDIALNLDVPIISNIVVANITTNSATIHWSTDQLADSRVDYGPSTAYGAVASSSASVTDHSLVLNGLTPYSTYHFRITSANSFGNAASSSDNTFTTQSALSLSITSPFEGEIIAAREVLVQGTFSNSTGEETGVVVNGILASIDGNQFVANNVPLAAGANTLSVTATSISGDGITESVNVQSAPPSDSMTLSADSEAGVAPLQTTLKIESTFPFTTSSLSYSGPGAANITAIGASEYQADFTIEGIYLITAEVTDEQGTIHSDTIAITVLNVIQLDTMLKGKWADMKTALTVGDIDGAMALFAPDAGLKYRRVFETLGVDLPQIIASLPAIELIDISENVAEYVMTRFQNGQARLYIIEFNRDAQGLWRIESF